MNTRVQREQMFMRHLVKDNETIYEHPETPGEHQTHGEHPETRDEHMYTRINT